MNGSERSESSSLPDCLTEFTAFGCKLGKPGKIHQTDSSWQTGGMSRVSKAINSGKYFLLFGSKVPGSGLNWVSVSLKVNSTLINGNRLLSVQCLSVQL